MIIKSLYLSEDQNLNEVIELTELSMDEIESVVGRFRSHSSRAGQLRGELIETEDGQILIRHAFTKKVLWSKD